MHDDKGDKLSSSEYHIGRAIGETLGAYRLRERFDQACLVAYWSVVVGGHMAQQTRRVYVKDRIMFVEMHSAASKQDLFFRRKELLKAITDRFSASAVEKIIFLSTILVLFIPLLG